MEKIKVDVGIPAPTKRHDKKYPFDEMEIGDSFFVADKKSASLSAQAGGAGKKLNRKFITRTENNGVRVWRVK